MKVMTVALPTTSDAYLTVGDDGCLNTPAKNVSIQQMKDHVGMRPDPLHKQKLLRRKKKIAKKIVAGRYLNRFKVVDGKIFVLHATGGWKNY